MREIDPRVDLAFKKIFGVEENKDLLISLINAIVSKEDQVSDVTLLNPYNPQSFYKDKLSILDIKAKSHDGKRFNIELQISDDADYDKRALYYWGKLYTEQLKSGSDYEQLSKAIGIHILNFVSIPNTKKYHNVFNIREKETYIEYFKDLELHTIELKKFVEQAEGGVSEIALKVKTALDMWTAFLARRDLLNRDNLPKELDGDCLDKAISILEVMNFSAEEREAYEGHLKWLMVEQNTLKKAKNDGFNEGKTAGMAAGIEEGLAKGIEEGIEIVAKNLLSIGVSITDITKSTGLTEDQIRNLK